MTNSALNKLFKEIVNQLSNYHYARLNISQKAELAPYITPILEKAEAYKDAELENVHNIAYRAGYEDGFKFKEDHKTTGWKEAKSELIRRLK